MGNPLSPILADIVLEKLFKEKLPLLDREPTFIFKYVDDIIIGTFEQNLNIIQDLFNSFHEKLKFTIEIENNNILPFLDTKLHRCNNKIKTEWYKKEIASNTLLNFLSVHPYKMRINVAHSFIKRALYLTDAKFRYNTINKIANILIMNNYPIKLIKKLITSTLYTYNNKRQTSTNERKYGTLPYIPNLSEKLSKTLKQNRDNLMIANKIINKTSDTYTKLKDKIPTDQKCGLIYKIKCKDCDSCYVGETSKTLTQRVEQHKRDIINIKKFRNGQPSTFRSALVKHCHEKKHDFDTDNASTLEYENKKTKRLFKESCHIWLSKNPVNYKVDTNRLQRNYYNIIKNYT